MRECANRESGIGNRESGIDKSVGSVWSVQWFFQLFAQCNSFLRGSKGECRNYVFSATVFSRPIDRKRDFRARGVSQV
ncbi:hypothetical protein [Moorena producens]|uniref:hypothetical protein n=1 Tax=Moorena producens TaxID=1155739 RepID=UPI003C727CC8